MSRWINTDQNFLPHVAKVLDFAPSANCSIVSEFDDVNPIAAVVFDNYTGVSAHVHIWVAHDRKPSRMFWWAVYHYAFEQLKCKTVIGTVAANNKEALRLDKHLGFKIVARVPNYFPPDVDMLLHVLEEKDAPNWRKWQPKTVVEGVFA
ncbi:GNAT family N-acetyltransferase [Stenotrophomonas phage BUCT555]|nr:GNAT family N-acetyltransferase [Stenotrophomonas phage BUCT555]